MKNHMKGLNKTLLASIIAATSVSAHAELSALDDQTMGQVTGQAGVTIELETSITLGQLRYTDEGSLTINNVVMGGGGVTTAGATAGQGLLLDDIKLDIDIAADGDAIITVGSISGNPRDWGMTAGSIELEGTTDGTVLLSNISSWGFSNGTSIVIDTATDHLTLTSSFSVEDANFDMDFLAIGVRNMTVHGATGQFASVSLDIFKGNGLGASGFTDVLRVDVATIAIDVGIGAIEIGGTSIGSVTMDDLVISNTKLAVYGH